MKYKKQRIVLIFSIILVLTFVYGIAFVYPFEPCGKYRDKKISASGLAYMEFKGGTAYLVVHKTPYMQSNILDSIILGTYAKRNNRWIYYPKGSSSEMRIKSTFLAIEISDMNDVASERYPKIFFNH